jgi:hypothetical protein
MELNELQNRLTNIITGISNTEPKIIQGITQSFIKHYTPDQTWVISITDIEGIEQTTIEYYTWDKNDGPIPGIKLFKDLNIFLEREYCEY